MIDIVENFKKSFSLLHLIGLRSRVYYTLLVCDLGFTTPLPILGGGGGGKTPLAPPQWTLNVNNLH